MTKTHNGGELSGGTPPPPDPPDSFACISCGDCSYSNISFVQVTVYPITLNNCTISQTAVSMKMDYYSDSAEYVEWRYDANNYIRRYCATNTWVLTTDQDTTGWTQIGACPTATGGGPAEISTCSRYQYWVNIKITDTPILLKTIDAIVKRNSCPIAYVAA